MGRIHPLREQGQIVRREPGWKEEGEGSLGIEGFERDVGIGVDADFGGRVFMARRATSSANITCRVSASARAAASAIIAAQNRWP